MRHATLGHISPHHSLFSSVFRDSVPSLLRRSESSFSAWHSWLFSLVWRSEPLFCFGVQIRTFSFGVQSHLSVSVWRLEPLFIFLFGVQSHFFHLAFRAAFSFRHPVLSLSVWRSEPLFLLSLGVQSRYHFLFDVQSHHCFSISAFRAIVSFSFGVQSRSSPSLGIQSHLSSFGVQSHYPFPAWHSESLHLHSAFRVMFCFIRHSGPPFIHGLRHSESPCHTFSLAFKAIFITVSVLAFRAITIVFPVLAFRAIIITFSVYHHRFSVLAFKVILILNFGVQSHHHRSSVWRSELSAFFVWCSEPSSFSVWHSKPSSFL